MRLFLEKCSLPMLIALTILSSCCTFLQVDDEKCGRLTLTCRRVQPTGCWRCTFNHPQTCGNLCSYFLVCHLNTVPWKVTFSLKDILRPEYPDRCKMWSSKKKRFWKLFLSLLFSFPFFLFFFFFPFSPFLFSVRAFAKMTSTIEACRLRD